MLADAACHGDSISTSASEMRGDDLLYISSLCSQRDRKTLMLLPPPAQGVRLCAPASCVSKARGIETRRSPAGPSPSLNRELST